VAGHFVLPFQVRARKFSNEASSGLAYGPSHSEHIFFSCSPRFSYLMYCCGSSSRRPSSCVSRFFRCGETTVGSEMSNSPKLFVSALSH
jgi:hypothetical protein